MFAARLPRLSIFSVLKSIKHIVGDETAFSVNLWLCHHQPKVSAADSLVKTTGFSLSLPLALN